MRHKILTVLLLVCGLGGWGGCNSPKKQPTNTSEEIPIGKKVVITDSLLLCGGSDTLRLGRLGSGEQAVSHFYLENQTAQPVVIIGHELTCGCIDLTYENKPIAPNGYLPVAMQFDSRGLYGWQLKLFYLRLHGSDHLWRFYIEAMVE